MPIQDKIVVLLPRAMDRGSGVIAVRNFPLVIYVNRQNMFKLIRLTQIAYTPSWAKVEATILRSGIEFESAAGDEGIIPLEHDISETEPSEIQLANKSIDTEARFTLHFQSWQYGEG